MQLPVLKRYQAGAFILRCYMNDIMEQTGISAYRMLKDAGLHPTYLQDLNRFLSGGSFPVRGAMPVVLQLYSVFGVPFNFASYVDKLVKVYPELTPNLEYKPPVPGRVVGRPFKKKERDLDKLFK